VRGLLEVVLEVDDLERSLAFYRNVVGLAIVEQWPEPRRGVWLSIGRNTVLGLWPPSSGGPGVGIHGSRGGAHVHLAIYVDPGALESRKRAIAQSGLEVEGPIEFDPGNRSIFVTDPDGNVLELADWVVDWAGEKLPR
jgi:catechol 2,3-dioxygenase-like lactoylglutathione lyase family enzyme